VTGVGSGGSRRSERVSGGRSAVIGAALLIVLSAGTPAAAARPNALSARALVSALAARGVILSAVTVTGRFDLRPLLVVRHPFVCHRCRFTGPVLADDVSFQRTIDLSGSDFERDVWMRRVTFAGIALFGPSGVGEVGASFGGGLNFSLATFRDLASFEYATIGGPADFSLARFRGDAVFASAEFDRVASFERASFAKPADFRSSDFQGGASFERADFARRAVFANSMYGSWADFADVTLEGAGDFIGAVFGGTGQGFATSFERLLAGGNVDFGGGEFDGRTSFKDVLARGALSFGDVTMPPTPHLLNFDSASAPAFSMDVEESLSAVRLADREHVLGLIEEGAKARGDLRVANDAHYELEVLRSRRYRWPRRTLDVVAYRTIAGYFVRPLHPLGFLLALAALVAFGRTIAGTTRPPRKWLRAAHFAVRRLLLEFLDAIALVGSRRESDGTPADRRRIEAVIYRLLAACALIGLANSNPTLRQMFHALL
jgi:uncharacterized protein YjbI with pentapeptide repeats